MPVGARHHRQLEELGRLRRLGTGTQPNRAQPILAPLSMRCLSNVYCELPRSWGLRASGRGVGQNHK